MNDEHFMKEAIKEAKKAKEKGNYGIGAVVVLNNKIISRSGNEFTSKGLKPWAHAELLALEKIRGTKYDCIELYKEMILYSTVAPCPQCWGLMIVLGIKKCVYGTEDPGATQDYEKSVPSFFQKMAPEIIKSNGIISEECEKIHRNVQNELDKEYLSKRCRKPLK